MLPVRKFKSGTIIFEEGSYGVMMYIVVEGSVQLYVVNNKKEVELSVVNRNDFFGEIEMYGNSPRGFSARTLSDTRLVCIKNRMQLEQFFAEYPAFSGKMMRIMGERLATTTALL
ncbi:MAG: Crp/Fnr family transcriptional regulator [Methylococcaceae bacterium]|jgi:CRP-like cAMP-binding protein|nr:Crp/Fnr family transcriptional regulator [Methylococcales bacterium]MCX7076808.1 Crp/Fnr family transcriptional regulator [Methylococcales bacterium]